MSVDLRRLESDPVVTVASDGGVKGRAAQLQRRDRRVDKRSRRGGVAPPEWRKVLSGRERVRYLTGNAKDSTSGRNERETVQASEMRVLSAHRPED